MKRNYTRKEIEELILDLSSENDELAEFAMTALLIANPNRHLSDLINALEYVDSNAKQRICYILGGIADKRCIEPLLSALKDKDINTKLAAIDSLQYFPDQHIIPHLEQQLRLRNQDITEVVISTLGTFIKNGVPDAEKVLIDIIKNENERLELRRLAVKNLKHLEKDQLRTIISQLKNISGASVYAELIFLEENLSEDEEIKREVIGNLINRMSIEDDVYLQMDIEEELVEYGEAAAEMLITKILENPKNINLRVRARLIFEDLGNKCVPAFKTLLESFNQFDDIHKTLLFQDLLTVVTHKRFASLKPSMLIFLQRINDFIARTKSKEHLNLLSLIKSDVHYALALYGSREAIDDLLQLIGDGTTRKFITVIQAIEKIGDKRFLIPLINQYLAYGNIKLLKTRIKKAFKAIIKREKMGRNDPLFSNLNKTQQEKLNLLFK